MAVGVNALLRTFRSPSLRAFVFLIAALTGPSSAVQGEDATRRDAIELFEKHVRPALLEHCVRCHGIEKQKGGLRLDSASGLANGGDSGAAVIPGDTQSRLLQAIRYQDSGLEMPPRGKLPKKTIDAFETWIALGAFDPRIADASSPTSDPKSEPKGGIEAPSVKDGRSFWAFQPLAPVAVPTVHQQHWPVTEIDHFVLAKLEDIGIQPNPPADRATLLRRITYDLAGLPPTPEEIDRFIHDSSPGALAKVVDRLLHSPRFGQRWGRHWLDVVRFAESSGGGRTLLLPDAWRYRDYVIDCFNTDIAYDRFLTEQVAGDLLPSEDWRQRQRNLIATGFLLLGPTNYEMQDKDILEMDVVDEQLDTIGKAFLGMTIGCARCHDHKFDPIPANDYYAMAGIFKSTASLVHSNVSKWNTADLPMSDADELRFTAHQKLVTEANRQLQQATRRWKLAGGEAKAKPSSYDPQRIDAIVLDDSDAEREGQWTESTAIAGYVGTQYIHDASEQRGQKRATYRHSLGQTGDYEVLLSYTPGANRSSRVPVRIVHATGEAVVHVNQRETPRIGEAFVSLGRYRFDANRPLRVVISNEDTNDGVVIADSIVIVQASRELAKVFAYARSSSNVNQEELQELKEDVDELERDFKQLKRSGPKRPVAISVQDSPTTGDIHLAIRGVAGQHGELTQRGVMQAASWQPFPPIPPDCSGRKEFAEWLSDHRNPLTARVMVNRVWYWMMGRGIVRTLDNFGSMGEPPIDAALLDHLANHFIRDDWSIKKLIRRIALSRVYQLNSHASDAADSDPANLYYWRMNRKRLRAEDIRDSLLQVSGSLDNGFGGPSIKPGTTIEYGYQFDTFRRSVYLPVFRNTLPEVFEVFDFADPNIQVGQRNASTIASQALWMMNHPMILERSRDAGANLLAMQHLNDVERIRLAHMQVLGRPPTQAETKISLDLVSPMNDNGEDLTLWTMLYQTLFQCLDFRFLN